MSSSKHVRLTDVELAELRALEGVAAVAQKQADVAKEYAAHRLGVALKSHGVEIDLSKESWQLDSETGLVVAVVATPQVQQ